MVRDAIRRQVFEGRVLLRGVVDYVDHERRELKVDTADEVFVLPRDSQRRLPEVGTPVEVEVASRRSIHRLRTYRVKPKD